MGFVFSRARRFARKTPGSDVEDFVHYGVLGLMEAIGKYDPTQGTRFITYATWWIDNAIRRHGVNEARGITASVAGRSRYIVEYRGHLADGMTHEEAIEAVAEARGATPHTVLSVIMALDRATALSLDAPMGEDGRRTLLDTFAAPEEDLVEDIDRSARESDTRARLWHLRKILSHREIAILDDRILCDDEEAQTLQELAERFDCTRERIRQVETTLWSKIRLAFLTVPRTRTGSRAE